MSRDTELILCIAASFAVLLALCYAVGYYGSNKGYLFGLCFLLGILTSPLVALIIIYLLPEREAPEGDGQSMAQLRLAIELEKARMAAAR